MEAFQTFRSIAAPLSKDDVDTDQIIPAQFLTRVSASGYADGLFYGLRQSEPDFPLSSPEFSDAKILVSGRNFGCGSSREHAVWALRDAGIKVVIAKSFADIFSSNSAKNGVLLIKLDENIVDALLEKLKFGPEEIEVNLEEQRVVLPLASEIKEGRKGGKKDEKTEVSFSYDAFRKHCLLEGLEDLEYMLEKKSEIESYFSKREQNTFYQTTRANR